MWSQKTSPSADLYFSGAMRAALEDGTAKQLSPTVFSIGNATIVVRHLSGLRRLPDASRLIYIMDDDWRAGIADRTVSLSYRAKLALREGRAAKKLEEKADLILASSQTLAESLRERLPGQKVEILEPAWPLSQNPLAAENPASLVYISASTHRTDFLFIKPILERLLARETVTISVSANAPVPKFWKENDRVTVLPIMTWDEYRNWLSGAHFDIALYPTLATPFNLARSRNKLLELDQIGAAIVCSSSWESGRKAASKGRCLAIKNSHIAWLEAVDNLIEIPNLARSLATKNRCTLSAAKPQQTQLRQWKQILAKLT